MFVQTADVSDIQQETADAISNLAAATASDRATVATLIETKIKLTQELITFNSKLVNVLESYKQLIAKLRSSSTKQKKKIPHYCYTCGSGQWHSNNRCCNKFAHHKDEATEKNEMGGSNATLKTD